MVTLRQVQKMHNSMKLFFLLPLLICFSARAQFNMCENDSNNYSGECKMYYRSGVLRKVASFDNGKLHGDYREYSERGEVIAEARFDNGHLIGKAWRRASEHAVVVRIEVDSLGNGSFTSGYFENVSKSGRFKHHYRDGDWINDEAGYNEDELITYNADSTVALAKRDWNSAVEESATYVFLVEFGIGEEADDDMVVDFPDVESTFDGSSVGMQRFIIENVNYPLEAIEKDIAGKVYVSFVVEIDGTVTNVKVEKSVHKTLDDETVRLMYSMPAWIPGELDGKIVRTRVRVPVSYTLTSEEDKKTKRKKRR